MPPRKLKTNVVHTQSDNALAKQAMDAIRQIDTEAHEKKLAQLEQLKSARATILERINELHHQRAQIDKAMEAITVRSAPSREKGGRRNLKEVKERVAQWMEGRKGQKFNAADLVKEFPELQGVSISMILKPLVESGKVHTDASDGAKRLKYFVAEG
jgi:seryl-tRNA synthetase